MIGIDTRNFYWLGHVSCSIVRQIDIIKRLIGGDVWVGIDNEYFDLSLGWHLCFYWVNLFPHASTSLHMVHRAKVKKNRFCMMYIDE